MKFIIKDKVYDRIADYLKNEVGGFSDSSEFRQLDSDDFRLQGVVCAAFAKFWIKIEQNCFRKDCSEDDREKLDDCYRVIEELSNSQDTEVVNMVVTEIFENMRCSEDLVKQIINRLHNKSKSLYEQWILGE